MKKKRIAVIHHSGSGSTRTIGEILAELLSKIYAVDTYSVKHSFDYGSLSEYDLLIIGTPTYNCAPSKSITEFVEGMPKFDEKPAFIYTTFALYSGNSLRNLAKALLKKGVVTSGYAHIKGPASDGALLFPSFGWLFNYEKGIKENLEKILEEIDMIVSALALKPKIPIFKWYVPLNWPNQYFGEKSFYKYREKMKVLADRCTNCNTCVKGCIRGCWTEGEETPRYSPADCEFCVKCIHNCPSSAIVLSEKMADKPRLNKKFYREKKEAILKAF
jgi:ferredoxin/flavodoxin